MRNRRRSESLPGLRSGARGLNFRFGEPVPAGGAAGAMVTVMTANLVYMRLILIISKYGQSDLIFFLIGRLFHIRNKKAS
jgi:hypothetical protein